VVAVNQVNEEAQSTLVFWIIGIMTGTLAFVVPFSIWVIKRLMKLIESIIGTLHDIAEGEGDVTRRLDQNRSDEIGDLVKWFNEFANRIHDLVCNVSENAHLLSSNSVQLQSTSESLSNQVATAAAISSIRAISDVISHVNEFARSIAASVEEQSVTTRQISENVNQTANAVETVASGVAETAVASREITERFAEIDAIIVTSATGADESMASARELSVLAAEMS
jgi:methyl-accepting chemotaxis protein